MAAGVPVVATKVGGIPELIEHGKTGMLVPSGDELAFSDSLEYCLHNAEVRESLVGNARRFAMKHFTTGAVLERYERLYDECLARKGDTRRLASPTMLGN